MTGSRLTEDQKRLAGNALGKAISAAPRNFNELWPIACDALGETRSAISGRGYRFTDGWLQKQKKIGNIAGFRHGRSFIWHLTNAGKLAFAEKAT